MPESKRLLAFVSCLLFAAAPLVAQGPKADGKKDEGPPKVAAAGATPAVGEIVADYAFKNLVTGDGRANLKEFRGNVVLIDWWGYH